MSALPETVAVRCPRCDNAIACTLELKTDPDAGTQGGLVVNVTVPDLAERMAQHYNEIHPNLVSSDD